MFILIAHYSVSGANKKYLIDSLGIPDRAIIMEPQTRYTKTNSRNTNRIFLSRGVPGNLPVMIVSTTIPGLYYSRSLYRSLFKGYRFLILIQDYQEQRVQLHHVIMIE